MKITDKIYNKDFRRQLVENPKRHYKEIGDALLDDVEIVVRKNTKKITYIVMPSDNLLHSLEQVQAAAKRPGQGTVGTAATAFGSLGCVTTTISTVSSVSSVGSASTAACG